MDILNLEEQIKEVTNDSNKELLTTILTEFKHKHYSNVLEKVKVLKNNYPIDAELGETLSIIEIVSYAEMKEYQASSKIIKRLYQSDDKSTDKLMLYGELAYMSDLKLARRILSNVVKRMEVENEQDRIKRARGYLVLGEAEEQLGKNVRAIKYYNKGLEYFNNNDTRDNHMIMYLHFKIGMLNTTLNQADEAIFYLEKAITLAKEYDHMDIRINSLVSIGKTLGSKGKEEKAITYLQEALELIYDSSLKNTLTHADALTEMAFIYFEQSHLGDAVPLYEEAIFIYEKHSQTSARKLGMIFMQYAYCLENKSSKEISRATRNYEKAIEYIEKSKDQELLENALADVIAFLEQTNNKQKKRTYENKFVKMVNG